MEKCSLSSEVWHHGAIKDVSRSKQSMLICFFIVTSKWGSDQGTEGGKLINLFWFLQQGSTWLQAQLRFDIDLVHLPSPELDKERTAQIKDGKHLKWALCCIRGIHKDLVWQMQWGLALGVWCANVS